MNPVSGASSYDDCSTTLDVVGRGGDYSVPPNAVGGGVD